MPKTPPKFTKHVHLLLTENQYKFVKNDLNGGIGYHVRGMIDAYRGHFDKELSDLEKELAQIEPVYMSLKKQVDEKKAEKQRIDDERKTKERRIEETHQKLIEAWKNCHYRPDEIPKSTYKIYADFCGVPWEELKAWLQEHHKKWEEAE